MFKLFLNSTIKDGSKYTSYRNIAINRQYYVINGRIYVCNISDTYSYISGSAVITKVNGNRVLLLPVYNRKCKVACEIPNDTYGVFIQRSEITFNDTTININDQAFKINNVDFNSNDDYLYCIKDKVLFAYRPTNYNLLERLFEFPLVDKLTPHTSVIKPTSEYDLFLEQFKHFQTQTIKKVAEVDCDKMVDCITTLSAITEDVIHLGEFYNKK